MPSNPLPKPEVTPADGTREAGMGPNETVLVVTDVDRDTRTITVDFATRDGLPLLDQSAGFGYASEKLVVAPLPWKCEVCGGFVREAVCSTDGQRRPEVQS